jgi:hypothetical protein
LAAACRDERRGAVARENGDRERLRQRYSRAIRKQAVDYWPERQREGDRLGDVAAALGVTAGSEKVKVHTETRESAGRA